MVAFVNLDTISRPSTGTLVPASWMDQINDNDNWLYGDTSWTSITSFTNSWTGTAAFRRVGSLLRLHGLISGGTAAASAFTLPIGWRPARDLNVITQVNGAAGWITVAASGVVVPQTGGTTNVCLDGLTADLI